jgi:hypothetical protein
MGFPSKVNAIELYRWKVAFRPAAAYGALANTIFTIRGGPVIIMALFGRVVTGVFGAGGCTGTFTVSGVPVDSGAVAIASAVNTLIVSPLDDAALAPVIPNVAALNLPLIEGLVAVTGNIVFTVGVAPTVGTVEWYCAYYAMNLASEIN